VVVFILLDRARAVVVDGIIAGVVDGLAGGTNVAGLAASAVPVVKASGEGDMQSSTTWRNGARALAIGLLVVVASRESFWSTRSSRRNCQHRPFSSISMKL
jgi:hypothetical protein